MIGSLVQQRSEQPTSISPHGYQIDVAKVREYQALFGWKYADIVDATNGQVAKRTLERVMAEGRATSRVHHELLKAIQTAVRNRNELYGFAQAQDIPRTLLRTRTLELTIDEDFESWTTEKKDHFLLELCNLLEADGDTVQIRRVSRGSIKVELDLTPAYAEKLYWAVQTGQLRRLNVVHARFVERQPPAVTTSRIQDYIAEKVRDVLVDALGVDREEVTLDATLIGDLGAESIDFLDIVFRLERAFDIKIQRGQLFPAEFPAFDHEYVEDGIVTEAGVAELREMLKYADVDKFASDPRVEHVSALFTVRMIYHFLEETLA